MKTLVIIIFVSIYCLAQQEPSFIYVPEECFQIVGGLDSLQSRLQYPAYAKENGIEGNVYVIITVDTLGIPSNPLLIKGIGCGCDEEAIRLVLTAKYLPAIKKDKAVRSQTVVKVKFKLSED